MMSSHFHSVGYA